MSTGRPNRMLLIGLLVGAGLGFATVLLFAPRRGSGYRASLFDRARDVADQMTSIRRGPRAWHDRKTERAGRRLMDRIERIRSAGL